MQRGHRWSESVQNAVRVLIMSENDPNTVINQADYRHTSENGVLLVGRQWPAFTCVLGRDIIMSESEPNAIRDLIRPPK